MSSIDVTHAPGTVGRYALLILVVPAVACVDLTVPWGAAVDGGLGRQGALTSTSGSGAARGTGGQGGGEPQSGEDGGFGGLVAAGGAGSQLGGQAGGAGGITKVDDPAGRGGAAMGCGGASAVVGTTGGLGGAGGDGNTDGGGCSCSRCDGLEDAAICWRLGGLGASCAETCADRGGTSPLAPTHVGTIDQGGSGLECERLFRRWGIVDSVITVSIKAGLGCHMKVGVLLPYGWASSPTLSDDARAPDVRILCGCRL